MSTLPFRNLLVGDEDAFFISSLADTLRPHGFIVHGAREKARAFELLRANDYALVVATTHWDRFAAELRQRYPAQRLVLVMERRQAGGAAKSLAAGAHGILNRPDALDAAKLVRAVQEALRGAGASRGTVPATVLIGQSPAMQAVTAMVARLAVDRAPVLITGETGTGKELVAQMLHEQSPRAQETFVAINCAAMPAELLESELFGHVKGAFTGATADNPGLCVHADGGTLLLDEIGAMPVRLQAKLLRFLSDGEVRPVGGTTSRAVDVRVLAATNEELDAAVAARTFREDLFYRLNVLTVQLPALRQRDGDVALLAQYFAAKKAAARQRPVPTIAPAVMKALEAYRWPGNVRELEHAIERMVALCAGATLQFDDLPERLLRKRAA